MLSATRPARRVLAALVAFALLAGGVTAVAFATPAFAAAPISQVTATTSGSDGSQGGVGVPLLGENTTFTVSFKNIATDGTVGYGPRVDLYFDRTGMDGDAGDTPDGMTFVSATYLGQAVSALTYTIPALDPGVTTDDGKFMHPVLKTKVDIPAGYHRGDQLVVLTLPFGSFTPGQPTVDVSVTAAVSGLADLGVSDGTKDLGVLAQPWFRYGTDALDNPTTDPPVYGTSATVKFRPALYRLSQSYLGPEGETATGPDYVRSYRVSLDIAAGQTITTVNLKQMIEGEIAGTTMGPITPGGGTATVNPDNVTVTWPSVSGTSSSTDASFDYSYYVKQFDNAGNTSPVLDPATGASATTTATATATNKWMATDNRDNIAEVVPCSPTPCTPTTIYHPSDVEVGPYTSTFTERSLAVQKSHNGSDSVLPGTLTTWTVNTQVSDYFAFGSLKLKDIVTDGLEVDPNSFAISWPGQSAVTLLPSERTVSVDTTTDGATTLTLDLSAVLDRVLGQGGFAIGQTLKTSGTGTAALTESGPETFSVTYATTVLQSYRSKPLVGSRALSPGDIFSNSATVTGTVATPVQQYTSTPDHTPTATSLVEGTATVTDGSSKSLSVSNGVLTQEVYARNGVVGVAAGTHFAPGDLVTYRIKQTLPVQSYENLTITDYLPLPVQNISSVTGPVDSLSAGALPAVNHLSWGPSNTVVPTDGKPDVTVNTTSNSFKLDYGTREVANQVGGETVDVLVTVRISNDPFADGLLLTNQARSAQTNSFSTAAASTALAQFVLAEPDLTIRKGILATDDPAAVFSTPLPGALSVTAPGSSGARWNALAYPFTSDSLVDYPLGSSLSNVEAGHIVTYALVIENTGNSANGAFDVNVSDAKSDFLVQPTGGYNVQVRDGLGQPVPWSGSASDLFGSGITLDDSAGQGAVPAAAADGSNVIVITYDLMVAGSASTGPFSSAGIGTLTELHNTGTIGGWAGIEGGPRFASRSDTGKIEVVSTGAIVTKEYTGAEQSSKASKTARVGEHVGYRITVNVPVGHHDNFIVRDTMSAGLAFASTDAVTIDAGGTNASTSTSPTLTGQTLEWNFGTLENNTSATKQLVISYSAMVKNTTTVNGGDTLSNTAWAGDNNLADQVDLDGSKAQAPDLTVIEPILGISASTNANFPDSGDVVAWTVIVTNSSAYTAYGAQVSTPVPTGVTQQGAITVTGATGSGSVTSGAVLVTIPTLAAGASATIAFNTKVGGGNGTGTLSSTSVLTWQSIPTSADHTPRTGTGTAPDDYRATTTTTIAMSAGGITKQQVATSNTTTSGSDVAIGETVSFKLRAQLPEGDTGTFSISDQLPTGMNVVTNSIVVSAPGFDGVTNPTLTPTIHNNTTGLVVNFDAVTLPGDNDTTTDFVEVTYDAYLTNSTSAIGATTSSVANQQNTATLTLGGKTTTAQTTMRYVQPVWTLSNTVSSATLRPNDAVTYTLKATNTGAAQANDVAFSFTIPNANAAGATQTLTSIACGTTPANFTCAITDSGNDKIVTYTQVTNTPFAANGSTTTGQFNATVTGTVSANRPDSSSVAVAAAFGATANAASTTAADYTSGATRANRVVTGSVSRNLTVRIPDPYVTITNDTSTTNIAAGTVINWTVTPKVNTIATENVTTTVVLSAGQTFTSAANSGTYDSASRTITWPVSGALATSSTAAFTFVTAVVNPAPESLTTVTATASVTNMQSGGTYLHGTDPNLVNNSAPKSNGVTASPDLMPTISDGHASTYKAAPGENVTWSVTVRNIGNRDTSSGSVTVAIPAGVSYVNSDPGWTATVVGGVTTSLTWSGIALAGVNGSTVAETAAKTITVKIDDPVKAGIYTVAGAAVTSDPNDANTANNTATDPTLIGGNPDIHIVKSLETTGNLTPGTSVSWLVTVTNTGNRGAEGLAVVDTLPTTGTTGTYTFSQVSGVTVPAGVLATNKITWSGGVIEAGATTTFRVGATLSRPAPAGFEQVTNAATAQENGANGVSDPAPSYPLSSSVTTPVVAAPNVGVSLTNGVTALTAGTSYTYQAVVTNAGNQTESGATLVLDVPVGVTPTALNGGTYDSAAHTITWTGLTITGNNGTTNGTVTKNVTVTIDNPQAAGQTHKLFTATVTTSSEDTNKADNVATDDDPLTGAPVLTIAKTADKSSAAPGDTVVYTLTATNSGTRGASGVVISDTLPAQVQFVSASNGGTNNAGVVSWPSATVAGGGATKVVTVTVTVLAPAPASISTLDNNAGVCDDGTNGTTSTPVCASTSKSIGLNARPDYAVILTPSTTTAAPGDSITYTVRVDNVGLQNGVGGELVVTLPANTTLTNAGGGDTSTAGSLIFHSIDLTGRTVSPVVAGGFVTHDFVVRLNSAMPAGVTTLPSSATVVVSRDNVSANDTANAAATLGGAPNLVVTKSATASVVPGGTITWSVVVTNAGNRGAQSITLTDTLPSGIGTATAAAGSLLRNTVTSSVAAGVVSGSTVTLSPGTVEVGDTYTYSISASANAVTAAGVESLTNSVTFGTIGTTNGTNTSTPSQLTATATTAVVSKPDLSVAITDSKTSMTIGTDVSGTYTITLTNTGNQDTTTGEVAFVLPSWLTVTTPGLTGTPVTGGTSYTLSNRTVNVGTPTMLSVAYTIPSWVAAGVETAHASAAVTNGSTSGTPNEDGTNGTKSATDDTTVIAQPELVITSQLVGAATAGGTGTWKFTVVNTGTQGATGVAVQSQLPSALLASYTSAATGSSVSGGIRTFTWPTFSLNPGDAARAFDVTATMVAPYPAGVHTIDNTVSTHDDGTNGAELVTSNNTAELHVSTAAAPNMKVVATPTTLTGAPGDVVQVQLKVTNQGSADTTSGILTATVPAGYTVEPSSNDSDGRVWNAGLRTFTWSALTVAGLSGETLTRTLVLRVDNPQPAGRSTITIDATITATDDQTTNTADKSAQSVLTLAGAPDLRITQAVDTATAVEGDLITWTMDVDNIGVRGASGVTATMTVPMVVDASTIVAGTGSWDPATRTITWSLGTVAVGAPKQALTVTARLWNPLPLVGSKIMSTATVTNDGLNGTDTNLANNDDKTTVITGVDLLVKKTLVGGSGFAVRGETVTWLITVTNNGPQTIQELTVDEVLPAGVDTVVITPSAGTLPTPSGTWSGFTLAPGGTISLTVSAKVLVDAPGSHLVNTVKMTVPGFNVVNLVTLAATQDAPLVSPLAATGLTVAPWLGGAILLMLLFGAGMLLLSRRRRGPARHRN